MQRGTSCHRFLLGDRPSPRKGRALAAKYTRTPATRRVEGETPRCEPAVDYNCGLAVSTWNRPRAAGNHVTAPSNSGEAHAIPFAHHTDVAGHRHDPHRLRQGIEQRRRRRQESRGRSRRQRRRKPPSRPAKPRRKPRRKPQRQLRMPRARPPTPRRMRPPRRPMRLPRRPMRPRKPRTRPSTPRRRPRKNSAPYVAQHVTTPALAPAFAIRRASCRSNGPALCRHLS